MKGRSIKKRPVVIDKRKTSVSLEDPFWEGIKDIAKAHRATVGDVISKIQGGDPNPNLSSALRLHVIAYYRSQVQAVRRETAPPAALAEQS